MTAMQITKLTREQLFLQIEGERAYMMRFAMAKLRDTEAAEEAVQEALLAALSGIESFAGDASLRTWLTSILKFKVIDFQRRVTTSRERFATAPASKDDSEGEGDWMDQLFDETGHWRAEFGNWALPDAAHEQQVFFAAFEKCMDRLPKTTARVFFQREVMGEETEEICKEEGITSSNCWVILHRARMGLRECLETNWFGK
jgi:RNA polymerase sigma-70 factor (ECF subfamily)